jgi:uncharacterized protein (DUF2267 family)
MDHEQFLTMVAQIAHTDRDTAERASQIVLTVLGQHLTRGEAADVLRLLPEELQAYAWSPGSPERFPPEEFLRRVAEREGADPLTAERHARAVSPRCVRRLAPTSTPTSAPSSEGITPRCWIRRRSCRPSRPSSARLPRKAAATTTPHGR